MLRINSISGPRNISTALMYSFAQRPDTTVLDEPFYAFYLQRSGIVHPGKADVLKSQPADADAVRQEILKEGRTPVLFIKNMAHHMALLDQGFVEDVTNIFLIRNPRQILASYADVIEAPTLRDIGIEYQFNLFNALLVQGKQPPVVDAGLILENPQSVLRQLCDRVGIPFFESMLHWTPGPKEYDGVWAPHWYANAHRSSGFEKQHSSNRALPAHLETLYEQAQSYYEALLPFSLQP